MATQMNGEAAPSSGKEGRERIMSNDTNDDKRYSNTVTGSVSPAKRATGSNYQTERSQLSSDVTAQPLVYNERLKVYEINIKQKEEMRWVQILGLLAKNDINSAAFNAERMFDQRKQIIEENKKRDFSSSNQQFNIRDIYGLVSEGLLLAKCKLLKASIPKVEELLTECEYYLSEMKISIKDIKKHITEIKKEKQENKSGLGDDRSSAYTRKYTSNIRTRPTYLNVCTFADYKWMLSAYATIAAFYNAIGNQIMCEMVYVKYVQWIEKYFGKESLEASNCYYLVGIYYFENDQHQKSLACFIKALYIRSNELGATHPSCADCQLNMGILYKRLGVHLKAIRSFEEALQSRRDCIGSQSLPVAKVLEELGKYHLEKGNYKQSYQNFQECYEIRKRILRKPNHQDIERISCLLLYLHKNIEQEIAERGQLIQQNPTAKLVQLSTQVVDIFKEQVLENSDNDAFNENRPKQQQANNYNQQFTFAASAPQNNLNRQGQNNARGLKDIQDLNDDKNGLKQKENQFQDAIDNYIQSMPHKQQQEEEAYLTQKAKQSGLILAGGQDKSKASSHNSNNPPAGKLQAQPYNHYNQPEEDDDIQKFISKGFNSYFDIVKKQLFERVAPYIIGLLLSLRDDQMKWLQKLQVSKDKASPLYILPEFKDTLNSIQLNLFTRSEIWKVARNKYLSGDLSLKNLIVPEANNKAVHRQHIQKDEQFFKLIKEVPQFIQKLNDTQEQMLKNTIKYQFPLKYFFVSITKEQIQEFEAIVVEQRKSVEYQHVLKDLAQIMPSLSTKQGNIDQHSLQQIMDYRQEMCTIIDNIKSVEVFRSIDVDLPDGFLRNLELNQIQRLTKLKTELQQPIVDVGEVQLTLKRFICDLDIKEAYEFSALNQFLINEEELQMLVADIKRQEQEDMNDSMMDGEGGIPQLDLNQLNNSSSGESDDNDFTNHINKIPLKADEYSEFEESETVMIQQQIVAGNHNSKYGGKTPAQLLAFQHQQRQINGGGGKSDAPYQQKRSSNELRVNTNNSKAIELIKKKSRAQANDKRGPRKSLMNIDLDRIASESVMRDSYERAGQAATSFSFTGYDGGGGGNGGNNGQLSMSQQLNMIKEHERDSSALSSDDEDDSSDDDDDDNDEDDDDDGSGGEGDDVFNNNNQTQSFDNIRGLINNLQQYK